MSRDLFLPKEMNKDRDFFLRPQNTSQSIPVKIEHEHYDSTSYDIERSFVNTRVKQNPTSPVQSSFQNNYYMMNFFHTPQDSNPFLPRNPTNTRRDNLEKSRQSETQEFMQFQGGTMLTSLTDLKAESTRKVRNDINSASYISMPRTLAIPKENI
jgi:hypothetical protein